MDFAVDQWVRGKRLSLMSVKQNKAERKAVVAQKIERFRKVGHVFKGLEKTIAGRAAVPIFRPQGTSLAPALVGSGVFFRLGDDLFLFTAAHVAEEFNGKTALLPIADTFFPVIGVCHPSPMPASGNRDHDQIDFAVVRIRDTEAKFFMPFAATLMDICPPVAQGFYHRNGLVIMGFPAKRYKRKGRTVTYGGRGLEAYGALPEVYEKNHVAPDQFILMERRSMMFSEEGARPSHSLRTMSGSGVWLVLELVGNSCPFNEPKLMGIFIEHKKQESLLVSTSIRFHLTKIVRLYPSLDAMISSDLVFPRTEPVNVQAWRK